MTEQDLSLSGKPANLKQLLANVSEAKTAQAAWRRESWTDYEFKDGVHWTRAAFQKLLDKGINPITVNRIFPILNLIQGNFIRNQKDLIAKGRTKADNELAQVMSESFAYVKDQNRGAELLPRAFNDGITAGFGCIEVGKNPDPRNEVVQWLQRAWYSMYWDPYASPWMDKDTCRYVFSSSWKNLEDLMMIFPEKRKELLDKFSQLSSTYYVPSVFDPSDEIENRLKYLSSNNWVSGERKRICPVEMWYTSISKGLFAVMPDSRVIDVDTLKTPGEQVQVIKASLELVTAHVKKMRVATFVSDLLLQDIPSPHTHDQYPFVPFIGYLDRYNQPFGVPRQVREQSMEVNKRRSMALALMSNRRILIEEGASSDLKKTYAEANRQDGFIVLKKGKLGALSIQELGSLAAPQIDLMNQSERELQEIVGANDEALGKESKLQSGIALDKKENQSAAVTLSLMDNANHSLKRLGILTLAGIQSDWKYSKVLRVIDRVSGAEKFIELNQRVYNDQTGAIEIHNNITEAQVDVIVASAPITDTMREKNMELLFSAINKAPPEAVGPLLNMAFEISDIPGKDALLKQVRAATGLPGYENENMSQTEQDAAQEQLRQQKQQSDAAESDLAKREREAKIAESIAKVEKMRAEATKVMRDSERQDWQAGHQLGKDLLEAQTVNPAVENKMALDTAQANHKMALAETQAQHKMELAEA